MSNTLKLLVLFAVLLAAGAGLVYWKNKVGGHSDALNKITKEEMEMLVKDFNPMQQRMLAQDPEQRKELAKNIKEFVAIASQARKEGYADKPEVKQELKYMKKAILALSYDKVINKDKPMAPLSMISEEQVAKFWGKDPENAEEKDEGKEGEKTETEENKAKGDSPEGKDEGKKEDESKPNENEKPEAKANPQPKPEAATEVDSKEKKDEKAEPAKAEKSKGVFRSILDSIGLGSTLDTVEQNRNESNFKEFLEAQLKLEEARGQRPPGQEMNPEQLKQMRDAFARFSIYEKEAKEKLASIASMDEEERKVWEEFEHKVELQTKLQQAQLLAQVYAREKLVPKLEVKEEEIEKYIADHPELIKEKQDKAEEILKKVQDGEDFAKLAKENSDDPGSKEKGGLYEDVPKGQMVPEFEAAIAKLEPGQVAAELVKTKFGFHIIKLEKRGKTKGPDGKEVDSYTARHILINTTVKDKESPMQQEVPLEAYVSNKLKQERQDKILEEILKNNPVEVAEDFEVVPPAIPQQPQLPPGMQLPQEGPPESNDKPQGSKKKE